jgi:hypothetical protein
MAILWNSNYEQTIPFSDVCAQLALAADTDLAYTVPGTATTRYSMILSYISTSNVFVCKNAGATVPGPGLITQQQYEEFRPGADGTKRYVSGGDVLHFITPDTSAYVGIRLMQLPQQ